MMLPNGIPPQQRIFTKAMTVSRHDIYIDGVINGVGEYREELETIRNMSPDDATYIHYNTVGGSVMTALAFVRAMQETEGTVFGIIEGECMSAGTFMFLSGHAFDISDHSIFMCHTYSGGHFGKGHEIYDKAEFDKAWSDKFIKDVYRGFLTDEELAKILDGKDLWIECEKVLEKCQNMVEFRQAEEEAAEALSDEEGDDPVEEKEPDIEVNVEVEEEKIAELFDTETGQELGKINLLTGEINLIIPKGKTEKAVCKQCLDLLGAKYTKNMTNKKLMQLIYDTLVAEL
ncbi:ATP-dependent Clp protease proteolytic subunit [bacterium]|nr:ATP-dependent Clp protease proteolytic subunit [bacterium]